VNATGHVDVGARFATAPAGGGGSSGGGTANPTLSVKIAGGKGVITSVPGGINWGNSCAASVVAGTAVTLTASSCRPASPPARLRTYGVGQRR
jgi:hypothetical protein